MENVLITGAGGFIGSHLAERCVELGYNVTAFIRYNSRNHWGWLEESKYKKEIKIVLGDIRDFDLVFREMRNIDTVFHLAALIGIPYSYVSPLAYIKTNIIGVYNILESAKLRETKNILITSTSETYGTAQYIPIDEKHPSIAQSPYAATKICSDQLALSYYHSFRLPIKIPRPFNTYGPRQSSRAFIPTIITQLLSGKKYISVGNIYPTRDYTYVLDTINGFLEIKNKDVLNGHITNIGMMEEISMKDLAVKIANIMGKEIEFCSNNERIRPQGSEVERLCCDNKKILNITNWKPEYDLDAGLKSTIAWFKNNRNKHKDDIYNI